MPLKLTDAEHLLKEFYKAHNEAKQELIQINAQLKLQKATKKESLAPSKPLLKTAIIKGNNTPIRSNELVFMGASSICHVKSVTSAEAAANTKAAKNLLASGKIKLAGERKTMFKRSSILKKRLNSVDGAAKRRNVSSNDIPATTDNLEEVTRGTKRPAAAASIRSSSLQNEQQTDGNVSDHQQSSQGPAFKAKTPMRAVKPGRNNSNNNSRSGGVKIPYPKRLQGNTVYVYGWNINEELLKREFDSFGNIIELKEGKNSGFITYDTCESADKAISEKNETMIGDCRVKVSLARRQPLLHRVGNQTWKELSRDRSEKGTNEKDSRTLQSYDAEVDNLFG